MTAELDRGLVELRVEFVDEIADGRITRIGTYGGCRRKNHRPGAPYSEHAWPGGNAADVHVADNETGDRVAAWMRSRPDLWAEVFWEIPLHWDHVHGTANPRRNYDNEQIPPCAGGPEDPMTMSEDAQAFWQETFERLQTLDPETGPSFAYYTVKHLRDHPSGGGVTGRDVDGKIAQHASDPDAHHE